MALGVSWKWLPWLRRVGGQASLDLLHASQNQLLLERQPRYLNIDGQALAAFCCLETREN